MKESHSLISEKEKKNLTKMPFPPSGGFPKSTNAPNSLAVNHTSKRKSNRTSRNASVSPGAKNPNPEEEKEIEEISLPQSTSIPSTHKDSTGFVPSPQKSSSPTRQPVASSLLAQKSEASAKPLKEAKAIHAHNQRQLERLSSLVLLTRATRDVCDWEAASSLEVRCLTALSPFAMELAEAISKAEQLVERLKKEFSILDSATPKEDPRLTQMWAEKEDAFVKMFLRHRDRFLKLQQSEALCMLAEWERDALTTLVSKEAPTPYAHNGVSREYLRPDI